MEKLKGVLKKTGKASVRELAAILKIDFRDALALLKDHEQEGRTECVNGYWQLTEARHTPAGTDLAKPSAPEPEPEIITAPPAAAAPLTIIWSSPQDVQEFPTLAWVRQRRRELKNEMRWLSQIENIARQINRKKAAMAYFRGRT